MKKLVSIKDSDEAMARFADSVANAQAGYPRRKYRALRISDIFKKMEADGWLSQIIAAASAKYTRSGKSYSRDYPSFKQTRIFREWQSEQPVPPFDERAAVPATVSYFDPNQQYRHAVLVDHANGLVLHVPPGTGKRLIGYADDLPATVFSGEVGPVTATVKRQLIQETGAGEELPLWKWGASSVPESLTPNVTDYEGEFPRRIKTTVYRILRDTELAQRVKVLYDYECQICGHTLILSDGSRYAEAHHIRPLGQPHNGPDALDNLLCVCPNHHAALDYRVERITVASLRTIAGHKITAEHVQYHNDLFDEQDRT